MNKTNDMDYCSWQPLLFELKCIFKHTHTHIYLQYIYKIPIDFTRLLCSLSIFIKSSFFNKILMEFKYEILENREMMQYDGQTITNTNSLVCCVGDTNNDRQY